MALYGIGALGLIWLALFPVEAPPGPEGFLLRGWVTPTAFDLSLMMATGVVAAMGLTLLTQAYRIAEASVVTPFEYTAMVWSVIYGWIIWQDWPRVIDWIGIAIIIGSGLYILWRDAARAQD